MKRKSKGPCIGIHKGNIKAGAQKIKRQSNSDAKVFRKNLRGKVR